MGDFNDNRIPAPCLRLDYGFGGDWESIELGDGTGYVRASALRRACEHIAAYGSCPYDQCYREGMDEDCGERCREDIDYADCWARHFMERSGE